MDALIVEDDLIWSEALYVAMEASGFRCILARSVGGAMALINRMPFRLVVLDLFLPDGASASLATYIRIRHPGVPILSITGAPDAAEGDHGAAPTADYLLRKPIPVEQAVRIAQHLARTHSLRQPAASA